MNTPLFADRQSISLAREVLYGVSPNTGTAVPANAANGALFGWEIESTRTGGAGRAPNLGGFKLVRPGQQVPSLHTYLYESPEPAVQFWTLLLEASGFKPIAALSVPGRQVWAQVNGPHASASVGWWLDGIRHTSAGVRGTLVMTFTVGLPVELTFAGAGIPMPTEAFTSFPAQPVTGRALTACDMHVRIEPDGAAPLTPRGEQIEVQTNSQLTAVRFGSRDPNAMAWRVMPGQPTIRLLIEATRDWDWWKKRDRPVHITGQVGTNVTRWDFEGMAMRLTQPPQWVRLNSGLWANDVVFGSTGERYPVRIARSA